jgi:hypothetical protein
VEGWSRKEGNAYVRINSAGLRDREHSMKKPDGVYRIAVLGDSYAEALQIDLRDTFWSLLERKLAECAFQPGKRVEVINYGVSGYGTAQEYLQLESTVIGYGPDLVLLLFNHGNDVVNNSILLEKDRERPFFRMDPQGRLTLDKSWAETAEFRKRSSALYDVVRFLSDRFRVVQLVQSAKHALESRRLVERPGVIHAGNDPSVMAPPRDRVWEDAWAVTDLILAKAIEYSSRNNIQFVLVLGNLNFQVDPDRDARVKMQEKLGVDDLFYVERRVEAFAKTRGTRLIPLAYEMQRLTDLERVYFHGFQNTAMGVGHWNENGHRAAAQIIASDLCGKGIDHRHSGNS